MKQIILASHGNLAEGAVDTVRMIVGDVSNIHVVTLQRDDTDSIKSKLNDLIATFDPADAVFILTDVLGSSVNNSAVEFLSDHPHLSVISGMNLPLILTLVLEDEKEDSDKVIKNVIMEGRRGILDCSNPEDSVNDVPAAIAPKIHKGVIGEKTKTALVRLDYRLLHGQIVFSWVNTVGANRIIVVDNEAATDEVKKGALKLAKPAGVYLNVFTVEKALSKLEKLSTLGDTVMFVFGNTKELLEFSKSHQFKEINYGATANKDGAEQIGGSGSSVFLDELEKQDTKELLALGSKIYIQQTPSHQRVELNSI